MLKLALSLAQLSPSLFLLYAKDIPNLYHQKHHYCHSPPPSSPPHTPPPPPPLVLTLCFKVMISNFFWKHTVILLAISRPNFTHIRQSWTTKTMDLSRMSKIFKIEGKISTTFVYRCVILFKMCFSLFLHFPFAD